MLKSVILGVASRVGRGATAAAAAVASAVVRGGSISGSGGGSSVGGMAAGAGHAAVRGAEQQVDEVVRILSPGPLAESEHPPTAEEMGAATEAVARAKSAWRDRTSGGDRA
mmetsp:Transcript_41039/g.101243  ORF Transcript_41039/g.101243 Transcript_41039/m.101243 type:complete len:111 (+) Transcript_41039:763-1095(+)